MEEMTQSEILKRDESGFTLMEIVAVLILVGILAAWAVPKFFDMQTTGKNKAAAAVLSEAQVRLNTIFSKRLYAGDECPTALEKATGAIKGAIDVSGFSLSSKEADGKLTAEVRDGDGTVLASGALELPDCTTYSASGTPTEGTSVCPKSITVEKAAETVYTCKSTTAGPFYGDVACYCDSKGQIQCSGSDDDKGTKKATDLTKYNRTYSELMSVTPMVWENLSEMDFQKCDKTWGIFRTVYKCENAKRTIPVGTLIQKKGKYYVAKWEFSISRSTDDDGNYRWETMWTNISNNLIEVTGTVIRSSNGTKEVWKMIDEETGASNEIDSVSSGNVYYSDTGLYVCTKDGVTDEPKSGGGNGWLQVKDYSN